MFLSVECRVARNPHPPCGGQKMKHPPRQARGVRSYCAATRVLQVAVVVVVGVVAVDVAGGAISCCQSPVMAVMCCLPFL